MDADQRARLRALCSASDDPVRVLRSDLADVLDALDDAERERDAVREEMRARLREMERRCIERIEATETQRDESVAAYAAASRECDTLRRLLDDAMRTLYAAPGLHSSHTVAEHIERTLYPERFAVERVTSETDCAETSSGRLHPTHGGGL